MLVGFFAEVDETLATFYLAVCRDWSLSLYLSLEAEWAHWGKRIGG